MALVTFISTKIILILKDNLQLKFRLKKKCNLSFTEVQVSNIGGLGPNLYQQF